MSAKLKPCPFCGCPGYLETLGGGWRRGACSNNRHTNAGDNMCHAVGPERATDRGAVVAWNRRSPHTRVRAGERDR